MTTVPPSEELREQHQSEQYLARQDLGDGEGWRFDETRQQQRRDVVMVVGSTGYFGKGVVSELRRQGVPLRLLGRSRASLEEAGYLTPEVAPESDDRNGSLVKNDTTGQAGGGKETKFSGDRLECVVCRDTSDPRAYDREWFRDVRLVVCVARPRSALRGRDHGSFLAMIPALCRAVRTNHVPDLLLLGLLYIEGFPFGTLPRIVMPQAEASAKEILSLLPTSSSGSPSGPHDFASQRDENCITRLTIMRGTDMNEIGFLLDFACQIGVWPCCWGHNPQMRPITAHDLGIAVASFVNRQAEDMHEPNRCQGGASWLAEFCVGGPQSIRWRELKRTIDAATGGPPLLTVDLPLSFYRTAVRFCRWAAPWSTRLERVLYLIVMMGIPMVVNSTSDEHQVFGEDRIDEFLREHVANARRHAEKPVLPG